VEEFVAEAAERHDRPFPGISGEAMEILRDYSWPGNVRELRNLVESMVVLAPGRPIRPDDIPAEVRGGRGRTLLPAPIPRAESSLSAGGELRPELEFIFKTLVELRVDMDELRAQFEAYREERPFPGARPIPVGPARAGRGEHAVEVEARPAGEVFFSSREEERPGEDGEDARGGAAGEPSPAAGGGADGGEREEGVVVFRPGKTMEDLEREAIAAALASVDGNRRKAAELLGIGERTLYRKISKYDLEE
jgi:DNA-binding NtrC family response regulator